MENGKLKIMIVDSNQEYVLELENFIHTKLGDEVSDVEPVFLLLPSFEEGVLKLKEDPFDVVIADVYFGEQFSGFKLVEIASSLVDKEQVQKMLWMIMGDEYNRQAEKSLGVGCHIHFQRRSQAFQCDHRSLYPKAS